MELAGCLCPCHKATDEMKKIVKVQNCNLCGCEIKRWNLNNTGGGLLLINNKGIRLIRCLSNEISTTRSKLWKKEINADMLGVIA